MVKIILTDTLAKKFTLGEKEVTVKAGTIKAVIDSLDLRYPGIKNELDPATMSLAIDGEIFQDALFESLDGASEVCFIPRIGGGLK